MRSSIFLFQANLNWSAARLVQLQSAWREDLTLERRPCEDALARWLIERHAAQLVQAIQGGKINVWVQLFDNDDERRAYQSLFARSSDSVSVHDLVGG